VTPTGCRIGASPGRGSPPDAPPQIRTHIRRMRNTIAVFVLGAALVAPCLAESSDRWAPEHCLPYSPAPSAERPQDALGGDAQKLWNDAYRRGFRAIERGEYDVAESEMCRALIAAREFGARDWRFAETLDELGLIAFQLRDYELAERIQGAAIVEMLLAAGPQGDPLSELDPESLPLIRADCRSGIRAYTARLGWIHERVRGRTTTEELQQAPWRVFAAGYVPLDTRLARRLDWLVAQYLLQENLAAAEELTELQREILDDPVSTER